MAGNVSMNAELARRSGMDLWYTMPNVWTRGKRQDLGSAPKKPPRTHGSESTSSVRSVSEKGATVGRTSRTLYFKLIAMDSKWHGRRLIKGAEYESTPIATRRSTVVNWPIAARMAGSVRHPTRVSAGCSTKVSNARDGCERS